MAKKRPQSKGGAPKQKRPKKATTGQRPSLAPRATGVVTTSKAKRKKKDDKPPPAQGRKALVVKPARGVAVAETVQLWNVFRKKAIDEATRKKTVDAALSALQGDFEMDSVRRTAACPMPAILRPVVRSAGPLSGRCLPQTLAPLELPQARLPAPPW